jgi:hypothetical protein
MTAPLEQPEVQLKFTSNLKLGVKSGVRVGISVPGGTRTPSRFPSHWHPGPSLG